MDNSHVSKVSRFVRGSIWWCKDDELKICEEGKQHGTRPALIISSDDRGSSSVVEVLKITSQDKSDRCPGINIPMFMNGKLCYILCNQHFTVSTNDLDNFIGICPQDIMDNVERGILRACGMPQLIEMQSKYYDLTRTVAEVVDSRLSKYRVPTSSNNEVVDVISGVITGLNSMLTNAEDSLKSQMITESKLSGDQVIVTPIKNDDKEDEVEAVVKESISAPKTRRGFRSYTPKRVNDSGVDDPTPKTPNKSTKSHNTHTIEVISGVEVHRSPAGKIQWTLEAAQRFVRDCEELPLSQAATKWGFKNTKNCSQMKYVIRNKYNL